MKNKIICLILAAMVLMFAGCKTTTEYLPGSGGCDSVPDGEKAAVTFSGGDGLSLQHAAIITGATEKTGVRAEYVWLHEHYRGYRLRVQRLRNEEKKIYDEMDIITADGKSFSVFFDITAFFGKF